MIPPVPSPDTMRSLRLYREIRNLVRITGVGKAGHIALDIGAVLEYFKIKGVTDAAWQLEKMRIIFDVVNGKEKKNNA